ncbi:MAG: glycerate kinase [Elusimicrobiales bacterium]|nr:glycerate kinase [Elusimicrobiales bacterium]
MKILCAPNSFKGTLSSAQAAAAIARGMKNATGAATAALPVSDGGDGLMEVLHAHCGGRLVGKTVRGPADRPVRAQYCILKDGSAVIEIARASGLALLRANALRPMEATSFGTGELIADALERGVRRIYAGLGGSATNDGGAGMAVALGARLLEEKGNPVPPGVAGLLKLSKIDVSALHPGLKRAEIFALTDVRNPLLGRHGSARTYGPQKGAAPAQVDIMERALARYSRIVKRDLRVDIARVPSCAAAGGIAAGLRAFCGARLENGADFVLKLLGAEKAVRGCDIVVTGEGCFDWQTFFGKAPAAVARLALKHGKPVFVIAGQCRRLDIDKLEANGITAVYCISGEDISAAQAQKNAARYVEAAAYCLAKSLETEC